MNSKVTLFLVGDSTLCEFHDDDYYIPRVGYGTCFHKNFNLDIIDITNLALSGRSSRSFLKENEYEYLKDNLSGGDFLLIDFSHNDEKYDKKRYTNSNLSTDITGSFKNILYKHYILLAMNSGAYPILCTPIIRRCDRYSHITKSNGLFHGGDYPRAIKDLAKEVNVPFIDNSLITQELYDEIGDNETLKLHAMKIKNVVDNTHINFDGAKMISSLIINEIKVLNLPLKKFLI